MLGLKWIAYLSGGVGASHGSDGARSKIGGLLEVRLIGRGVASVVSHDDGWKW